MHLLCILKHICLHITTFPGCCVLHFFLLCLLIAPQCFSIDLLCLWSESIVWFWTQVKWFGASVRFCQKGQRFWKLSLKMCFCFYSFGKIDVCFKKCVLTIVKKNCNPYTIHNPGADAQGEATLIPYGCFQVNLVDSGAPVSHKIQPDDFGSVIQG